MTQGRRFHSTLESPQCQCGRVLKRVLPVRRHEDQALLHNLRSGQSGIETLEATDADALHPFQIRLDPFLGDVAAHPVPPDSRFSSVRGIHEAAEYGVAPRLAECHQGNGNCKMTSPGSRVRSGCFVLGLGLTASTSGSFDIFGYSKIRLPQKDIGLSENGVCGTLRAARSMVWTSVNGGRKELVHVPFGTDRQEPYEVECSTPCRPLTDCDLVMPGHSDRDTPE